MPQRHVLVLGAGVVGLSTAIVLQEQGHKVTVLADSFAEETLSANAPGIWTPHLSYPPDKVVEWCITTYDNLVDQMHKGWPVELAPVRVQSPDSMPDQFWWMGQVLKHFVLFEDRAEYLAPTIQCSSYLSTQMKFIEEKGGTFITQSISSIPDLIANWKGDPIDVIANCSGLRAKDLFEDPDTYPIRGILLKAHPLPHLPIRTLVITGEPPGFTYITCRRDAIVLGGSNEVGNARTDVTDDEANYVIDRCIKAMPELDAKGTLRASVYNNWAGLRPGRGQVRLELDTSLSIPIVHNYGHGASGWTICHGCALDVGKIISEHFSPKSKL